MPVKKQYFKTKPYCKVTFRLSKKTAGNARKASVAGDFNQWNGSQTPMKPLKNGDFTVTLQLPKGHEYQYRFVLDEKTWISDADADKEVYSQYANANNAVVVV